MGSFSFASPFVGELCGVPRSPNLSVTGTVMCDSDSFPSSLLLLPLLPLSLPLPL